MTHQNTKVAVIYGGTSSEREVSLASGKNVCKQLKLAQYDVVEVEITVDNIWRLNHQPIKPDVLKSFDAVYIALHGTYGEDGQIQRELDKYDIKYTGSSAAASALAFNKFAANNKVQAAGLMVPAQQLLKSDQLADFSFDQLQLSYPVVVKPNCNGSSVAVSIVRQKSNLLAAVQAAAASGEVLVQQYIAGRELTCGVLGDMVLPSVEIVASGEFFDYQAKYADEATQEYCPAKITPQQEQLVQQSALKAHRTLGCAGLTRSDFILRNDDQLYYLETNTIPGMTDTSLCPKEALVAGLTLSDLVDQQVKLVY